jgi:hypothetical protein
MLLIQLVNHDNPNQDENLFDNPSIIYNEQLYPFESIKIQIIQIIEIEISNFI